MLKRQAAERAARIKTALACERVAIAAREQGYTAGVANMLKKHTAFLSEENGRVVDFREVPRNAVRAEVAVSRGPSHWELTPLRGFYETMRTVMFRRVHFALDFAPHGEPRETITWVTWIPEGHSPLRFALDAWESGR